MGNTVPVWARREYIPPRVIDEYKNNIENYCNSSCSINCINHSENHFKQCCSALCEIINPLTANNHTPFIIKCTIKYSKTYNGKLKFNLSNGFFKLCKIYQTYQCINITRKHAKKINAMLANTGINYSETLAKQLLAKFYEFLCNQYEDYKVFNKVKGTTIYICIVSNNMSSIYFDDYNYNKFRVRAC